MPRPARADAQSSRSESTPLDFWNRPDCALALLLVAGTLVYTNSFKGKLVLDEYFFIFENPSAQSLRFWDYKEDRGSLRPVGFFTFAVNYLVGGDTLWGYHAVNLAIHLAAGGLVFALVRNTLSRGRLAERYGPSALALATVVAILWLVHPLQTQSVTYIYQRLESLMALFYLLTLYAFLRAQDSPHPVAWYASSVICCALGMGTKEVMITAPLAVLWYDRVFIAESWRELFRRRTVYYLFLASTWGVLAGLMVHSWAGYAKGGALIVQDVTALDYALNQPAVILHYLRLVFLPYGLCLEYGWPVSHDAREIGPPLLVVAVLLIVTLWAMLRRPALGYVAGMFFLILAPTSSIAPIKDLAFEHRMYLPLAPAAILIVLAAHWVWQRATLLSNEQQRRRQASVAAIILAAVVVALGIGTVVRNEEYSSALNFWQDNVQKRPANPVARYNFAKYLIEAGRTQAALAHLNEAIRMKPSLAQAHMNRAYLLVQMGEFEEALKDYEQVIQLDFDLPTAYLSRGACYEGWGKFSAAIQDYERAMDLKPGNADAYFNRGHAYQSAPAPIHSFENAIADYSRAIELKPDYARAYSNRGVCYLQLNNVSQALADENKAIELDPNLGEGYINRAVYYFTQKQYLPAWADIREARRLGMSPNSNFIRDLAAASGQVE